MSWFTDLWDGISPKVRSDFENFARRFADVALDEISKQALLTISGQQKLNDAADAVIARARAEGWVVLRTAAVTLVQDIYTAQKAKLGPLVAAPNDSETAALIADRVQNPIPDA